MKNKVIIYTDGACSVTSRIGGWAAILMYKRNGRSHKKEISGGVQDTTNNRMEIQAFIESIKILKRPCNVTVYTDSKYVQEGIGSWKNNEPIGKKGWIVGWKNRGWRRKEGPLINEDLWMEIDVLIKKHDSITMKYVRGHDGDELNERCDELAVRAKNEIITDIDIEIENRFTDKD